jgi:hypothetical protein
MYTTSSPDLAASSPDLAALGHRYELLMILRMKKKKERKRLFESILKTKTEKVACNPDSGPAVVLSAPRGGFLAYSQPPGASRSPSLGSQAKTAYDNIHKNTYTHYIHIYIYTHRGMGRYIVVFWLFLALSGIPRKSGFQGSLLK